MSKTFRRPIGQKFNIEENLDKPIINKKPKYSCCLSNKSSVIKCQLSEIRRKKTIDFPIELKNNGNVDLPQIIYFKNAEYNKITFIEFQHSFQNIIPPSGSFTINLFLNFPEDIIGEEYCVVGILDLANLGEYDGFTIFVRVKDDHFETQIEDKNQIPVIKEPTIIEYQQPIPDQINNDTIKINAMYQKELENYKEQIKNLQRLNNEILHQNENKERIIKELKEEIERRKDEEIRLKIKNKEQENSIIVIQTKSNQLEEEMREKNEKLKVDNKMLSNQVESLKNEQNDLNYLVQKKNKECCELQKQNEELEEKLSELKKTFDNFKIQYVRLGKKNDELKKKINENTH